MKNWLVRVYFKFLRTHCFIAHNKDNAMEIAGRIMGEGCWIENEDGTVEFFPVPMIAKIKIVPPGHEEPKYEGGEND